MSLHTPNEVVSAACDMMLDGRDPDGIKDQLALVNFVAANVPAELGVATVQLLRLLYPAYFGLVQDHQIDTIVAFQNR